MDCEFVVNSRPVTILAGPVGSVSRDNSCVGFACVVSSFSQDSTGIGRLSRTGFSPGCSRDMRRSQRVARFGWPSSLKLATSCFWWTGTAASRLLQCLWFGCEIFCGMPLYWRLAPAFHRFPCLHVKRRQARSSRSLPCPDDLQLHRGPLQ